MAKPHVLVIVLAGGAGGRLELLTDERAKPAVPFGGSYRLIDVPLSNAANAGLSDVWVLQQFNPVSLTEHLANGRPWDLDRTVGGLLHVHPRRGSDREGWHQGTADALWRNAELIRDYDPEYVVVVSSDALYRLDYLTVVEEHRASGAAVTMVTTEVDPADAGRYGVVQVEDGRVTDYVYKPDEPAGNLVSNEVFVFSPQPLLDTLEQAGADAGDEGLEDLGVAVLPSLVAAGGAREYRFSGYWRDVGTVEAYWQAHMDLLAGEPPFALDDAEWPLRTRSVRSAPARVLAGSTVADSILAAGARVAGTVRHSVVAVGAVVEEGAQVVDSVLLPGAIVRRGARVVRSVLDDDVVVGADARIGGDGDVTLIGAASTVPDGAVVEPGGRFPAEPADD